MLSAQNGESVSKADRQQALNVVLAWHLNGPYSECLAERGYHVPWQSFIHLPVSLTEGFGTASHRCRSVNPATDREWMTGNDVDDWDAALAEARTYGWSPDDPFALRRGRDVCIVEGRAQVPFDATLHAWPSPRGRLLPVGLRSGRRIDRPDPPRSAAVTTTP